MIHIIHQYKRTLFGVIALCFTVLLMTSFGVDMYSGPRTGLPAIVIDDDEISVMELARKKQELAPYARYFGGDVDQMVIDSAIANVLMGRFTTDLNLVSGTGELTTALMNTPAYEKGTFNGEKMKNYLRIIGKDAVTYEKDIRAQISRDALNDIITDISYVPFVEARSSLRRKEIKYNIDVITLDPKNFEQLVKTPNDEELNTFYQAIATKFEEPKKIKYNYAVVTPELFKDQVEVLNEDIELYYVENQSQFRTKDQVRLRHIQLSYPPNATEVEKEKTKKLAEDIGMKASGGQDFAMLAGEHSDDIATKHLGGDLGWVVKGSKSKDFEDVAFKLSVGQVSEPVPASYGYEIIKLEEKKVAEIKPLDEVRAEIKNYLIVEQAPQYGAVIVDKIFNDWKAGTNPLSKVAEELKVESKTSELLNAKLDPEPRLSGLTSKLLNFPADKKQLLQIKDLFILAEILDYKEEVIPPLNDIKEKVVAFYKTDKSADATKSFGAELLAKLDKDSKLDLKSLSKDDKKLKFEQLKGITKQGATTGSLADINLRNEVFNDVSAIQAKPRLISSDGKSYLVKIVGKIEPNDVELTKRADAAREQQSRESSSLLYGALLERLKAKANIVVNNNAF